LQTKAGRNACAAAQLVPGISYRLSVVNESQLYFS
jgi:hypothetical protein